MATPSAPMLPPLDCSLLFSDLINFHMEHNPNFPMFVYPNEQSPLGTTGVTFLEFGRAAHRIAHALRPCRMGDDGQVVMLVANTDTIHYHAVISGASVAGLVPFLVSPRNSAAAVVDMMKKTGCSRILTLHHAHQSLIDEVRKGASGKELIVEEMPTSSNAFPKLGCESEADPFDPYPPPLLRPDLEKPAIYIHSSGSTGFPKPCPLNYKVQIHSMTQPFMMSLRRITGCPLGAMGLPPFHGFALAVQLFVPLAHCVTSVVYSPQSVANPHAAAVIPTSDNILDCARRTKCKLLVSVPTFVEYWSLSEEAIEELKQMEMVVFGGGPLPETIGDRLSAAGVRLAAAYGGSEFGCPAVLPYEEDIKDGDWNWLRFGDNIKLRWVPQGDETYELQILSTDDNQLAVENLSDTKGYATSDLFVKHPAKNLWKIVGRLDDVITLASGEKTVPAPMEGIISSSPLLQGAVMFGRERNQVGVLVEPLPEHAVDVQDDNAVAEFRNKIWPHVERAHKLSSVFSRIFKEMILITKPEKPIPRTAKGTIQKKAAIMAYEAEINALYDAVEATYRPQNGLAAPSVWTTEILEAWLMDHARAINQGKHVDPKVDLFVQGFDSLSFTYLRNQIINALRTSPDDEIRIAVSRVSLNIVFENPTIKLLAARIAALSGPEEASPSESKQAHIAAMNAMIEKYSTGLIRVNNGSGSARNNSTDSAPVVVLLTGSTGGLGSFILSELIQSENVAKIYALNRPSTSSIEERQRSAFIDRGLSVSFLDSEKLVYVEADASHERCGLSDALYGEIRDSVMTIIHNAWPLNFNLSLASFEPNIRMTRNLVDLALNSCQRESLRFVFTSSVGSAQSWDRSWGLFPEEVQLDPSVAVGAGYGEAKYICERIITNCGLDSTSLRIGQIAGGSNGSWAKTDWVPILVKSSLALGVFPESRGSVSWMRAEDVAASVLDVAFVKAAPQVLNVVNPMRAPWTDIILAIRDEIMRQKSLGSEQLSMVPFSHWVARLEKRIEGATAEDLSNFPAIKLLKFFRDMAKSDNTVERGAETGSMVGFSTEKAQLISTTVAKMRPVGDVEARSWVKYWISQGLF